MRKGDTGGQLLWVGCGRAELRTPVCAGLCDPRQTASSHRVTGNLLPIPLSTATPYQALQHVVANHLHLTVCLAGICAHGIHSLPALPSGSTGSVVMYWYSEARDNVCYAYCLDSRAIRIDRDLDQPRQCQQLCLVRFQLYDDS